MTPRFDNVRMDCRSLLRERLAGVLTPSPGHAPDFNVREQDEFLLIADGDRAVGTFHRERLELDLREFYPDGRAGASLEIRRPYHNPSVRGAILPCNWRIRSQGVDSSAHSVTVRETGTRLVLGIEESFGEDESGPTEVAIGYDAELGCYAVEKTAVLALHTADKVEPANLWARGCGEAWPADATLRYTLWSNAEGGLTWFPHNPLTPNLPGNLDDSGPGRRLPIGGFIALGARHASNPAIEILDSHTAAVGCSTCSAFYDEHILQGCPAPLDETGKYRWRFRCRLVSLPEAAMRRLREQAAPLDLGDTPDRYDDWRFLDHIRAAGRQVQPFDISLPFVLGEVNHFDRPLDPRRECVGLYWTFAPQPHGRVTWDQVAHSLLMEGRDARADLSALPCGPSIRLHDGKGCRFSALVKTELAPGAEVWIEMDAFLYSAGEVVAPTRSPRLRGSAKAVRLEMAAPPSPGKDYLRLALRMKGKGRAWIDEIALVEA